MYSNKYAQLQRHQPSRYSSSARGLILATSNVRTQITTILIRKHQRHRVQLNMQSDVLS